MSSVNGNENSQEASTESKEYSADYPKLLENGLSAPIAQILDKVLKQDAVKFSELDQRAFDALKELEEDGALYVVKQFSQSNLVHVQNKSAFLCGIIKIHRQKMKKEKDDSASSAEKKNGPSEEKVKELLERTKYSLDVTTGQRKYGGPPPTEVYNGSEPGNGCQVFVGRIPRTVFEDELVPLLEKAGTIWDFRLMMDPLTGQNRGFGFVSYTNKESAGECVKLWDNYEIRPKRFLGVCVSQSNCRLFVGSIPKSKSKDEIFAEFDALTTGLKDVIMYLQSEDKTKNRGFCFLEYNDHKSASQARRKLSSPKTKAFNSTVSVDWADQVEEPSAETMSKVKVLYIKNLSSKATEEIINTTFCAYGEIERVKKIKNYAFVHFKEREHAMKAMEELNNLNLEGEPIEISLAKPVDKKRKERQMERKMQNSSYGGMDQYQPARRMGRGGRGAYGGAPMMGGYGGGYGDGYGDGYGEGYGDDYFTGDYMAYGFGGYDDGYYSSPSMHGMYMQGMGGRRGMYGGGMQRGRGGPMARGRGRGSRGGGGGQRGKGGMPVKRKASFGAGHGGKRSNVTASIKSTNQWGAEPIAQQPLKKDSDAQWFQDSIDEQWA